KISKEKRKTNSVEFDLQPTGLPGARWSLGLDAIVPSSAPLPWTGVPLAVNPAPPRKAARLPGFAALFFFFPPAHAQAATRRSSPQGRCLDSPPPGAGPD
ncbi:MAG: hypothetical protein ACK56I_21010, partial [bacterium]